MARVGQHTLGARAGKYKLGARAGKYKRSTRAGKYKFGARAGKYKLGARAGAGGQGRGLGNTNTRKLFTPPIFQFSTPCNNMKYANCLILWLINYHPEQRMCIKDSKDVWTSSERLMYLLQLLLLSRGIVDFSCLWNWIKI